MAIRFNKLLRPYMSVIPTRYLAEDYLHKSVTDTMVFLSHKTGDKRAEIEAKYIADKHSILVYMAEWDDEICKESFGLPDYIMKAIRQSDGFLLSVTPQIGKSMWIGYEIGGAHAMEKLRAKIMYERVDSLPSVIDALSSLRNREQLNDWLLSVI